MVTIKTLLAPHADRLIQQRLQELAKSVLKQPPESIDACLNAYAELSQYLGPEKDTARTALLRTHTQHGMQYMEFIAKAMRRQENHARQLGGLEPRDG